MTTTKVNDSKVSFLKSLLTTNRFYNLVSFAAGFIFSHCISYDCVLQSVKDIFLIFS